MIVLRGLGRGNYFGSLVAFGLTREVSDDTEEVISQAKSAKRPIRRSAFAWFEEWLESIEPGYEELKQEVATIVQKHHKMVEAVIPVPETEEGIKTVVQPFVALRKTIGRLENRVQKTAEVPYRKELLLNLQRARQELEEEEEEIVLLLAMELV
jgi:Zn-dependent M32 family carboxypeptidase